MGRRPRHAPLRVFMNDRLVGHLAKEASGAVAFRYDESWLGWDSPIPISLSLPLREDPYRGESVAAFFENLLPDSPALRRRVAERVGAEGTDAVSVLAAIGRDCVGALRFVPAEDETEASARALQSDGEAVEDDEIARMLRNLVQAPLGLARDEDFRISVAGAQEKTALLYRDGRWIKPRGATPTTHILKPQIGVLPNGIDLSRSVENELCCLRLAAAFGLTTAHAEMRTFGETQALVIERFDRLWTRNGRLIRLPQEDCCQALGVPPSRKYESDGGPGLVDLIRLFAGSDTPAEDQDAVLKAQIVFWLVGATDGHAKNLSLFLYPRGQYRLAPLYDILTAQPSLDARLIARKQMKLAMSVGSSRKYRIADITGRHFLETGIRAGLPPARVSAVIEQAADVAEDALRTARETLPAGFPEEIPAAVEAGVRQRREGLRARGAD